MPVHVPVHVPVDRVYVVARPGPTYSMNSEANESFVDEYPSIEPGPEVEIKVKGSRFLGQAFRVESAEAAETALQTIRRTYHDATHHCSAYRLGPPEQLLERSDDDGEPSGTAGAPILGALQSGRTFDALVVVTRYFGGTKLGTGGLVRAYAASASAALEAAPDRRVWREARVVVQVEYNDMGAVETSLARHAEWLRGVDRDYSGTPTFILRVRPSRIEALLDEVTESTAGRARFQNEAPP